MLCCCFGTSLVTLLLTVVHLFEACCCCCCSLWGGGGGGLVSLVCWYFSQWLLRYCSGCFCAYVECCRMHVSCVFPVASEVCFHFDAHLALIMLMI